MLPGKSTDKQTDLDLSIISDDEINCYNNSDGKQIQIYIEYKMQIYSKKNNLTHESDIDYRGKSKTPEVPVRKSKTAICETNRTLVNCNVLQKSQTRSHEDNKGREDPNNPTFFIYFN